MHCEKKEMRFYLRRCRLMHAFSLLASPSLHECSDFIRIVIFTISHDKSLLCRFSNRRFVGMALGSYRLLLGVVKDDRCLCLCIGQLIMQVLIILQKLANGQGLVGQVHAQLVPIHCQALNMPDHRNSVHRSFSKLIVLLS